MLKLNFMAAAVLLCLPAVLFAAPGFESAGHEAACAAVVLKGSPAAKLKMENGLELGYGEICALGGDFFGDADRPIVLGKSAGEMRERFLQAYASLAVGSEALIEVPQLLAVLADEKQQLADGMKNGEEPAAIYARMGTEHNIQRNCITGGFCPADHPEIPADAVKDIYFLQEGRYLKLADTDFDHFGAEAWLAYSTGHSAALAVALDAGRVHDVAKLETAYAMNAFASHFLTDGFSSGHMRAPHLMLYNTVTPATVGSLLTTYMHEEDSESGLMVSNKRGDSWKAFGDHYYVTDANAKNREILIEALQLSADEIFAAYSLGVVPVVDAVAELVPDLDKLNSDDTHLNTAPLFYWDVKNKVVQRRVLLSDAKSYAWTPIWVGWETLAELVSERGFPGSSKRLLLTNPDLRKKAQELGII